MFSLAVVCSIAGGDPRQRQHTQHEVAPMMCTVEEAVFIVSMVQKTKNLSDLAANILESTTDQKI